MDLARPAPTVETATVPSAPEVEPAVASPARPRVAPTVEPAPKVEPAAIIIDNNNNSPTNTTNGDESSRRKNTVPVPPTKLENFDDIAKLSPGVLKDTYGCDFESSAAIIRSSESNKKTFLQKVLPWFFDERDFVSFGEILRYIVISINCCFVYLEKDSPSASYVFALDGLSTKIEDPKKLEPSTITISPASGNSSKSYLTTVLLKKDDDDDDKKKTAYQLTFDTKQDKDIVERFCSAVKSSSCVPIAGVIDPKEKAVSAKISKEEKKG